LGTNPLPILLFTYYSLQIKFVPFLEKKPVKRKKDDKVGNKTSKGKEKKTARKKSLNPA